MQEWSAFEAVAGPILLHERIEVSNAFVAMTIAGMLGDGSAKLTLEDFMPRWDGSEPEGQSPDDIVRVLRELEAKTKKKGEANG